MKIFLSWSGTLSREVAFLFSRYLRLASPRFEIWFDEQSIQQGISWESQMRDAIDRCDVVLMFVTDNNSPWMLFEAGVAHSLEKRIVPVTVNISPSSLTGPLAQLQGVDILSHGAINQIIVTLLEIGLMPKNEQLLVQKCWELSFPSFSAELNGILKTEKSEKIVRDTDKARATDAFDKAWNKKHD